MTLRKEDGVINTNYNNHAGLGRKMSLKKKKGGRKEKSLQNKVSWGSLLGQRLTPAWRNPKGR